MRFIKITLSLLLFMFMLTGNIGEAATAETVSNGTELARIQRLAIAYPDYYKTLETEPTTGEFITAIYNASKVAKDTYVISYDEIAARIQSETGIDIRVLPKMDAKKIFKQQVYKYADGYLIVTLANNARVNMFCDVYAVNTNELLYTLRIEDGKSDAGKTTKAYQELAEQFYRAFDKAVQTEAKKKDKDEESDKKSKDKKNKD